MEHVITVGTVVHVGAAVFFAAAVLGVVIWILSVIASGFDH